MLCIKKILLAHFSRSAPQLLLIGKMMIIIIIIGKRSLNVRQTWWPWTLQENSSMPKLERNRTVLFLCCFNTGENDTRVKFSANNYFIVVSLFCLLQRKWSWQCSFHLITLLFTLEVIITSRMERQANSQLLLLNRFPVILHVQAATPTNVNLQEST